MMDSLREFFSYDPHTGDVCWAKRRGSAVAGTLVRSKSVQGYIRVLFNGKHLPAHRVAWFLMTGVWPDFPIDHANLDKSDNRWANLRRATPCLNGANRPGYGRHSKGTTLHKRTGKYQAQIKFGGKSIYLGLHDTEEQAAAAYAQKAKEFFGPFARTE